MKGGRRFGRLGASLRRGGPVAAGWSELSPLDRDWEEAYRARWQHDKVVRSTHGVNCTGSCSWKVYVKDGIITWETQETDYPTNGPDMPEYEPRGCPRGASFSWYTYSPLRVKHPYVRGVLWELWQEALREAQGDPVAAWARLQADPAKRAAYRKARGKGGLVRVSWDEAYRLIAASLVYTLREYGPDRIFGFTPIPAMSMVSYASGARFLSLLGGVMLSFYDWYADLPPASPQVWGEQTDVPESGDWYNASYLIVWGTNVPMTRTPDAHFLVEARYRGAKVVAVSPDYAEVVKFADHWLPARPGTDGALAMAMTHVILKEFYLERETPYFTDYARRFTDLPFLVRLRKHGEAWVPDRFLRASDLGLEEPHAEWKTLVWDAAVGAPAVPNGSLGFRWSEEGRWNLKLETGDGRPVDPALTLLGREEAVLPVELAYFGDGAPALLRRSVPAVRLGDPDGTYVTTVFDLLLAQVGLGRGLPGDYPAGYDDPRPYTPAWQEAITGVDRRLAIRVAREFAENAALTRGRSMILMGAGTNHWYHSDTLYRAMLNLVLLTGAQGVNGGGWAHYVGQEKVRPAEAWATLAFASDWSRPPRQQNGTSFFYLATDQWRYEETDAASMASPLAGPYGRLHFADTNALAARLGWLPSYPQFGANPLALVREAEASGARSDEEVVAHVVRRLREGSLRFAAEDPDAPENFPRVLFVWRANLLTSSGKGHEYFLKHLLGADHAVLAAESEGPRPREVAWREKTPEGKLDLLITLDFRMSGTALYSDVLLPAATWYEKHDLSSTDMHPFLHTFNPAIAPPWEARSDWDAFRGLARVFSELAARHLSEARDLVAVPLLHDSPDELAQPFGRIRDWRKGEAEPEPGRTLPRLVVVRRDYARVHEKMTALGPLVRERGLASKGIAWPAAEEYEELGRMLGTVAAPGPAQGCPRLEEDRQVAQVILTLSGTSHGRVAVKQWAALEAKTGVALRDLAEGEEAEHFHLADLTAQPRRVLTSPVWSGIEKGDRRYSPFTVNVERLVPWRTLTGRQQFYLDHELILDFGEGLPVYRGPLAFASFLPGEGRPAGDGRLELTLRYLTPHGKWGIHSTFADNLPMLTLFRGGPTVWLNKEDAAAAGIADNDWIECFNRNGVVVARAVVSHRLPRGVAFQYHAQDRTVHVPQSPITGEPGGAHNSLTRIHVKPTHMIGGYAQLSYGFNYYGPTGNQRDETVVIRKLREVSRLEG
ncbi:MAG: nitrate reductase subunit alpha [Clostridia bacterium]|nr:nitrate reductase subunit alpha [Clostridia bacterium]